MKVPGSGFHEAICIKAQVNHISVDDRHRVNVGENVGNQICMNDVEVLKNVIYLVILAIFNIVTDEETGCKVPKNVRLEGP